MGEVIELFKDETFNESVLEAPDVANLEMVARLYRKRYGADALSALLDKHFKVWSVRSLARFPLERSLAAALLFRELGKPLADLLTLEEVAAPVDLEPSTVRLYATARLYEAPPIASRDGATLLFRAADAQHFWDSYYRRRHHRPFSWLDTGTLPT